MHTTFCAECEQKMQIDEDGISNHLTEDGEIDYDQDADHVAIDEQQYSDGDGMSDAEADADVLRMAGWGTDEDYNGWAEEAFYEEQIERDIAEDD
jgi:hypothetical protein